MVLWGFRMLEEESRCGDMPMVHFERLKGVIARKVLVADPSGLRPSVASPMTLTSDESKCDVSLVGFVRLLATDVEAVNAYFVAEEAKIELAAYFSTEGRDRRLRALKRYAAVNYVAARKIAKKFDKNAAALGETSDCRRVVEDMLASQRFAAALRGDEELFTELEASHYLPSFEIEPNSPLEPRSRNSSLGKIDEVTTAPSLSAIAEIEDDASGAPAASTDKQEEAESSPPSFVVDFCATYITYGFVYSCRRALAVAKEPLGATVSTSYLAILDSALLCSYVSMQLVVARFGDDLKRHLHPERIVPLAVLAASAATLAAGYSAPARPALVAIFWACNGAAQALVYPYVCVILTDTIEPSKRGRVMGAWNTCSATGGVVSAALSAAALERRGMRGAFEAPAFSTASCGLLLLALLGRKRGSPRSKAAPSKSASSTNVWTMIRVPSICCAYSLVKPIRYLFLFWHNYYLVAVLGLDLRRAAAVEACETLFALIGGLAFGYASDRCSPFLLFALCLAFLALALLAFRPVSALGFYPDLAVVAATSALIGAVDNLASGLTASVLVDLNEREKGHAASIASVVSFLSAAGTIGTIVHSRIVASIVAHKLWFALFATAAAQAAIAALLVAPVAFQDLKAKHHRPSSLATIKAPRPKQE